jgi:hypothetical protein
MLTGLQHPHSPSRVPNLKVDRLETEELPSVPALDRLLAINEYQKSGLILCKSYYAEFAGPGALVSAALEQSCTAIVAIGTPEIIEVVTPKERQKAYGRRIQWMRWLQKITDHPDSGERLEKLLYGFEAFFGRQVVQDLPREALALLVGVLPHTVARSRQDSPQMARDMDRAATPQPTVFVFSPQLLRSFNSAATPFVVSNHLDDCPSR